MNKRFFSLMTLLVLVVAVAFAKPKVRIIATGGTIAGAGTSATGSAYTAGQVGVQSLIDAVPQMLDIAEVSGEQLVNIGSQDGFNTFVLERAHQCLGASYYLFLCCIVHLRFLLNLLFLLLPCRQSHSCELGLDPCNLQNMDYL